VNRSERPTFLRFPVHRGQTFLSCITVTAARNGRFVGPCIQLILAHSVHRSLWSSEQEASHRGFATCRLGTFVFGSTGGKRKKKCKKRKKKKRIYEQRKTVQYGDFISGESRASLSSFCNSALHSAGCGP
jgi:hypothetical protein